ncbi:hypothetical protein BSPA111_03250 [Buttiauxella sp. A111]|nr:hypothetical protein BSPA111_03250 [Buttiauxella sp. A111]
MLIMSAPGTLQPLETPLTAISEELTLTSHGYHRFVGSSLKGNGSKDWNTQI